MMRSLAALLLALVAVQASAPALAGSCTVTVEALDGAWAIGNVYTLGDDPEIEATTLCLLCGGTELYQWTLVRRTACDDMQSMGFVHALACETTPPCANRWIVTGNPSPKCWTLEECP